MKVTLSVDDKVIYKARRRAEAIGTSVNQLVREYLEQFAGKGDPESAVTEFQRLSYESKRKSQGWKYNRQELHERS